MLSKSNTFVRDVCDQYVLNVLHLESRLIKQIERVNCIETVYAVTCNQK